MQQVFGTVSDNVERNKTLLNISIRKVVIINYPRLHSCGRYGRVIKRGAKDQLSEASLIFFSKVGCFLGKILGLR